jgi:uncharacterized protein (TIGR02145 family)
MKKIKWFIGFVFAIIALIACNEDIMTPDNVLEPIALNSQLISTGEITLCGQETYPLTAGQTINAGTVEVSNDATNLYVTYTTVAGTFGKLHLWVGTDFLLLPKNKQGILLPGKFPYISGKGEFGSSVGLPEYTFAIPIADIPTYSASNQTLYFVAHAESIFDSNGDGALNAETSFAGTIPGNETNRWFFYDTYTVEECVVKDKDGNIYTTIDICDQTWLVENLKTTHYNDGSEIPFIEDDSEWAGSVTGAYCFFDHNETYKSFYGALYNWSAVNTGKLCPTGWHVPSDEEWHQLVLCLDPDAIINDPRIAPWESLIAGGKMKEEGTVHWETPNFGATNESGFTALPGGVRNADGTFRGIDGLGHWWSSTEGGNPSAVAWNRFMGYGDRQVGRDLHHKADGMSIRCLKN